MSEGSDQGEKVHDPTPQKLEDARKKGDVPRSMDMSAAAAMIGFLIAIWISGQRMTEESGAILAHIIDRSNNYTGLILGEGGVALARDWSNAILISLIPLFLLPFAASLSVLIAQQAVVMSTDKIVPKLSRLSLISNAKNKFGPTGLVQFLKNFVKMTAVSIALTYYLMGNTDELIGSVHGTGWAVAAMLGETLITLTIISCIIFFVIGMIDLIWQRFDHARKLKMSFQDIRDEHKQSEGDPHTKQQRQQRGRDIATNRMLLEVPNADVVIVNPTHYAVALKWSRKKGTAPEVVAKGTDEIAAKIRELASEHGIPIHRDPPTARAVFDTVEIGEEIDPKHYRAVAAAIKFATEMNEKAKQQPWH